MTEVVATPEKIEELVRERFDRVLVTSSSNTDKRLHLMSDEKWMRPVCFTDNKRDKWIDKAITIYPPGYHPICKKCAEREFGNQVMDE